MSMGQFASSVIEGRPHRSPAALAVLLVCVLVVAISLTWTFLGMRSVTDVGGTCAEGGPYEIATPCPDGAVLLSAGIPVLIISAMLGSAVALLCRAPNLLVPMWGLLFGSLGWNFLEYGFADDGVVWGWVICGVVFEGMAFPALVLMVAGGKLASLVPMTGSNESPSPRLTWYLGYLIVGTIGLVLGTWSFDSWT